MKLISVFRLWASFYDESTWTWHSSRTDKVIKLNKNLLSMYLFAFVRDLQAVLFNESGNTGFEVFGQTLQCC